MTDIEQTLIDTILPELETGRPNWDKPHTILVVKKLREILSHTPQLNLDETVLLIAAYAHDWGYAGLFKNGQKLTLDDVIDQKTAHAKIGVEKLTKLLEIPVFNTLTQIQKDRAVHLVAVHDRLGEWKDLDELILMEADTLGGIDPFELEPGFDPASNEKYMKGVKQSRIPYFVTDYGKREVEKLFKARQEYYDKNFPIASQN